jgi:hypothetical protein
MPKSAAKVVIPRLVRTELRRAADAAVDVTSRSWRLFLASAQTPALRDEAAQLVLDARKVSGSLDALVGRTTGRDNGECKPLAFAP